MGANVLHDDRCIHSIFIILARHRFEVGYFIRIKEPELDRIFYIASEICYLICCFNDASFPWTL